MEEARQALLLAEKGGVSLEDLRSLWATATKCTETEEELVTLYTTYIYMTRRYIAASGSTDYNPVEQLFQEALALVDKNYGGGGRRGGPTLDLRKNYAFYLYAKTKNIAKAREVWNAILLKANDARTWLEAIAMERAYGGGDGNNIGYVRALFYKAVDHVITQSEVVFKAFVQFEREEGSIGELDAALDRVNTRLHQQLEQQQQGKEKSANRWTGKKKVEKDGEGEEEGHLTRKQRRARLRSGGGEQQVGWEEKNGGDGASSKNRSPAKRGRGGGGRGGGRPAGKQDAVAEAGKQQPQGKGNRKGGKLQEELLQAELEDLLSPEEAEQMQQELEAMEEGDMDDSNESSDDELDDEEEEDDDEEEEKVEAVFSSMASIGPQIPGMNATVAPVTVEGQLKEMDMDLPEAQPRQQRKRAHDYSTGGGSLATTAEKKQTKQGADQRRPEQQVGLHQGGGMEMELEEEEEEGGNTCHQGEAGDGGDGGSQAGSTGRVSSAGGGPHKEPEDPACTVYLANLDFSVTKRDIARWFDDGEGNIQQIRQANRGVAFVDFSSREAAQAALARDGEIVFRNHKVLVSAYGQKGGKSYGKELERNKLFIRNLNYHCTEDELTKLFQPYGPLRAVRIVKGMNGKPKGIAYVEFESDQAAADALTANGTKIRGRPIGVLLSDPSVVGGPKGKDHQKSDRQMPSSSSDQQRSTTAPAAGSSTSSMAPSTSAGGGLADDGLPPAQRLGQRSRLQMVPRSLNRGSTLAAATAPTGTAAGASGSGGSDGGGMINGKD